MMTTGSESGFLTWDKRLAGRKLLITGGTGFFGRSILDRFLDLPAECRPELIVLSRAPDSFQGRFPQYEPLRIDWIKGDIAEFAVPHDRVDLVIHLATDVQSSASTGSVKLFNSIVHGTRHVLEWSVKLGVQRVLLASSGAVYGAQPPDVSHLKESRLSSIDPMNSVSTYALGKLGAEHLGCLLSAQQGLPVTIARCFSFIGPHLPLNSHFAVGNFMRDALNDREIIVKGDGTAVRSYMHTDDLVHWLMTILISGRPAQAYNVGSDVGVTMADLAGRVAERMPTPRPVRILKRPDPQASPDRYVPSTERARQELGLCLTCNLDQAIEATLNWHRNHRSPLS
jgi:dTDP-glucose 4,6-dehydratase